MKLETPFVVHIVIACLVISTIALGVIIGVLVAGHV